MTDRHGRISKMPPASGRQRGFTLFELVAYILLVSIALSVAFNRFADYPGEAERTSFNAVLMQLKAGVNLQMMKGIASGDRKELYALEGSNPMDLMLETPVNYVGEFALVEKSSLPRRIWYFDSGTGELVYIANDARNLYLIADAGRMQTDELRFRITMKFRDGGGTGWEGMLLEPTQEYDWESVTLTVPEVAVQ